MTSRGKVGPLEPGHNCGPGALAAITGHTLDEVRPHLLGFDAKRYTNPTMMFTALRSLGVKIRKVGFAEWPQYGLLRVQWEGPWTNPGVPIRARYRYTHWVGVAHETDDKDCPVGIFDINCMHNGTGWVSFVNWARHMVPALTAQYPKASGGWHFTHGIEVPPPC